MNFLMDFLITVIMQYHGHVVQSLTQNTWLLLLLFTVSPEQEESGLVLAGLRGRPLFMPGGEFNSLFAYKVNEIATYRSPHSHKSVKWGLYNKSEWGIVYICYAHCFIQICDLLVNDSVRLYMPENSLHAKHFSELLASKV